MTPEAIFTICSTVALAGWIVLILVPIWHSYDKFVIGIIITLFCLIYAYLVFTNFHAGDFAKFGSLQGVMSLFQDPGILVAGWVHYLAFDLLAGVFIRKNAWKLGIGHWVVVPCLVLTFMLGPVGLLLYLLIRFLITKRYFADNF